MYTDLAWTWPIISPPEDYVEETQELAALIKRYGPPESRQVLHLGCGGGHIDWTLKHSFEITGVDLSPEMLELAQQLNPEVAYRVGDMRTIRMERQWDAVLIADSIVYMLSEQDLRAAFETARVHLKPGGVFFTVAEHTLENFEQDEMHCTSHTGPDVAIHLVHNYYDPDPEDTLFQLNFVYLIRRNGKLTVEVEQQTAGLFSLDLWSRLLEETGFEVQQIPVFSEAGFVCRWIRREIPT